MVKMPKTILNHPAVFECDYFPDEGYRYDIILKEGWVFSASRNKGGRCLHANTVADFLYAAPIKENKYVN